MESWARAEAAAQSAIDAALGGHPEPTEPGVARAVAAAVPDGGTLMVSASMPVRDVEWYAAPRTGLRVVANRGANGIDGVVSTALGIGAAEPGRPTVALLGDLAFLHDAGGLLHADRLDCDCTLVVVDNDGGGIFSFLPQAQALGADTFDRLFGTPHGLDLAVVARAYGLAVHEVDKAADVVPAIRPGRGVRVVVVRTDRSANVAMHEELQAAVASSMLSGRHSGIATPTRPRRGARAP
jgi:2-succinyl-5-enolpyruvyl-6-hydroxy-3-cyclohexene-1-carboxylate synthase